MHIFGQLWPRFNLCDLMRKWWVNEIKLQNSTLYLKEKLCKPISRKKICPEYLQNSQMVLSMLCNDGKYAKKKICLSYFGTNVSENIIVSSNFFPLKSPLKFCESCHHSKRHINCFLLYWTVIEWFVKTKNRPEVLWGRITTVIWHCYVFNVLMSTE